MTAERVLVLRVCRADLTSPSIDANGFRWPEAGEVAAPDWDPYPRCGGGLHGWLWGEGKVHGNIGQDVIDDPKSRWLIVEVLKSDVVELPGKVKFPRGEVVFVGDREAAVAYLVERAPSGKSIAFHRATAGESGTATAGESGTATAGYGGTATAGHGGTATAGDRGTATAGESGTIAIRWYDPKCDKYRLAVAEVGESGIEPATAYCLDIVDGAPQWRKKEQRS